jgi:predicted Zn-dependent peptidase
MYGFTELPSGLRIVTARMPHLASVALGLWVGTGGRHEPARHNGVAHFIEHMLFKGTRRRTAARISQDIEGVGGYLNAFTDEELTCFYSRAVASKMPELVDVLLDMFLGSKFAASEIAKEREVILEEQSMYLDQPAEHVHDLLNAAQFPGHPLGRPVIGSRRSVRAIGRRDLLDFLELHYVAGTTVIAAAGDVDHEALVRLIRVREAEFRVASRPEPEPAPPPAGSPAVRLRTKATEQTHLAIGFRTVSRIDPQRHALRLLNVLLGENMSSRLFQVVREDHGLAYNIHSSVSAWSDCGDLVISAGLDDGQLEKVLKLVLGEARRLTRRPPGRAEFERARDYALGQADLALEGSEQKMMWLGEQMLGHGRVTPPDLIRARLMAVTPAAVQSAASEFFRAERVSLALVSPRKSPDGLASLLAGGLEG